MSTPTARRHLTAPSDGWRLALKQTSIPGRVRAGSRPLLIVPGYGMNSFIFGHHPRGRSMEAHLADAGFEVWSVDLRAQGESQNVAGKSVYGLADLGLTDVGAAIDHVLAHTETGADQVSAIGCSLGATLVFIQAALARAPRIGALVSMGGPLRLEDIHPVVKLVFGSPALVGLIPFAGTRRLAELALPVLRRVPSLLSIYLNPSIVDLSDARALARTVENPSRHVNRELARWLAAKDLTIHGENLTRAFAARVTVPLLSLVASGDGIVPRRSALSAHSHGRMARRDVLEVGTPAVPIAHADMFISDHAEDWVFAPMAEWLRSLE